MPNDWVLIYDLTNKTDMSHFLNLQLTRLQCYHALIFGTILITINDKSKQTSQSKPNQIANCIQNRTTQIQSQHPKPLNPNPTSTPKIHKFDPSGPTLREKKGKKDGRAGLGRTKGQRARWNFDKANAEREENGKREIKRWGEEGATSLSDLRLGQNQERRERVKRTIEGRSEGGCGQRDCRTANYAITEIE